MTITQLLENLQRAANGRRRRDRFLLIPVALLGSTFLALVLLTRPLGTDRTWPLLNWWFGGATVFLLYVVFSSGPARRRRGVCCSRCGWVVPDDDYTVDELRYVAENLPRYRCPRCNATIAERTD